MQVLPGGGGLVAGPQETQVFKDRQESWGTLEMESRVPGHSASSTGYFDHLSLFPDTWGLPPTRSFDYNAP